MQRILTEPEAQTLMIADPKLRSTLPFCGLCMQSMLREEVRINSRYKSIVNTFGYCVYVHRLHLTDKKMQECAKRRRNCSGSQADHDKYLHLFDQKGIEKL